MTVKDKHEDSRNSKHENEGQVITIDSNPTTGEMLKCFMKLAIPGITQNVLAFFMIMTNGVFAGRLGDPAILAAVGVGNVTCMIFLITMFMGLNSAQDSLTSQAYGSGNIKLCSSYLNRGLFINLVFYIPLAIVPFFYGETLLLALG